MKLILQRVNSASVEINSQITSKISKGLLIYLGISKDYTDDKLDWITDKILKLRLWKSERKGFDLSISDIKGEILVISQFTLYGDCKKGTKPNFSQSAEYETAEKIYNQFIEKLREPGLKIESGEFGAMMKIKSENDGPVTLILER